MKPETGIAVRSQMQEKLSSIAEQLKTLKADSETPYKTNGEFRFNPAYTANSPINIHKCLDLGLLISILSYLTGQSNNYLKATEILGLKEYPMFMWMGFGYDAWLHDIKIRVAQVTQKDKYDKLRRAKAVLESFMTEEDRLAIALKELESLGV